MTGYIINKHKRSLVLIILKNVSRQHMYYLPLQARDEVITVLRAEKIDLALLEAHYGFVTPSKVLQALQRDTIQSKGWHEDIYKKPIKEVRVKQTSLSAIELKRLVFLYSWCVFVKVFSVLIIHPCPKE